MEASNFSAFLPLLAVLKSLGLKICWFLVCFEETEKSTIFGLPKLDLDLVSMGRTTAWMAGLMNIGFNFCVEIQLVV